jgi:adenine-specific DNA-methyltransferase
MSRTRQPPPAYNGSDAAGQEPLFTAEPVGEDKQYLERQLMTYIGNKRALLPQIGHAVETVKQRLGKDSLRVFDAFSGSGVVSRYLKRHASELVTNDIESYARVASECYLANRSSLDFDSLCAEVTRLNAAVDKSTVEDGFIRRLYSPADEDNIKPEDRVFYTPDNARRLDTYRQLLDGLPPATQTMLLGPLLSEASVHANTAGVFKGFYKDKGTGIGKFGGSGADALSRIRGQIRLEPPVLSRYHCDAEVFQDDAGEVVGKIHDLDLVYLDPPYNQHPYGSNYFMLNLLVDYFEPTDMSRVSGIPTNWQRSDYNVRDRAFAKLSRLIKDVDARFVLLSFNNEGFVRPDELRSLLRGVGKVDEIELRYNTFRGSRNLAGRSLHVTEHLFLTEKK